MHIKTLLLGSAAALTAFSGAQAADAIIAAEPEPMEYVRVCDAFGTGFFYIPGTETCLRIGGNVDFRVNLGQVPRTGAGIYRVADEVVYDDNGNATGIIFNGDDYWDAVGRVELDLDARTDTELGTLRSFASVRWEYGNNFAFDPEGAGDAPVYINEAYIELGGFKAGFYQNWWDTGIAGETDDLGAITRMASVAYTYAGPSFTAGLQVDELSHADVRGNDRIFDDGNGGFVTRPGALERPGNQNVGIEALVSAKFGSVRGDLLGSYDFNYEEGAVRAILEADFAGGTFGLAGVWSSGMSAYYDDGEWALAASYAFKATDKLTITPAGQYVWNTVMDSSGNWTGGDIWRVGLTADYNIVSGLDMTSTVGYQDNGDIEAWAGFVRLRRSF